MGNRGKQRKQRNLEKKIYPKRNLGQKSYYLLSIYRLPLTWEHLLSFHASKRHNIRLPCLLGAWEGLLYLAKSSLLGEVPHFLALASIFWPLATETSFRVNIADFTNRVAPGFLNFWKGEINDLDGWRGCVGLGEDLQVHLCADRADFLLRVRATPQLMSLSVF